MKEADKFDSARGGLCPILERNGHNFCSFVNVLMVSTKWQG